MNVSFPLPFLDVINVNIDVSAHYNCPLTVSDSRDPQASQINANISTGHVSLIGDGK